MRLLLLLRLSSVSSSSSVPPLSLSWRARCAYNVTQTASAFLVQHRPNSGLRSASLHFCFCNSHNLAFIRRQAAGFVHRLVNDRARSSITFEVHLLHPLLLNLPAELYVARVATVLLPSWEIVPRTKCTIRTCLGELKLKLSYFCRQEQLNIRLCVKMKVSVTIVLNCRLHEAFEDFQSGQVLD